MTERRLISAGATPRRIAESGTHDDRTRTEGAAVPCGGASLRQLGRAYGFDRVFLGKLVQAGDLPAARQGRALKVLRADFEAWFWREAFRRTDGADGIVERVLAREQRARAPGPYTWYMGEVVQDGQA